jgi:hypothetical protein
MGPVPAKRRAGDNGRFSGDEIAETGSGEPFQAEIGDVWGTSPRHSRGEERAISTS